MEVDPEESSKEKQIMDFLVGNETISFKSQQRGESDLTKPEKIEIAWEIYNKSKLNFLIRFGKYLDTSHLNFFEQFTHGCENSYEISVVLKDCLEHAKKGGSVSVKNRRYEALKRMIEGTSYFSEIEMMKRNPLLYEQLVGQYLTEDEKLERDRINVNADSTLVNVLLEGIDRDDAKLKKEEQENYENEEDGNDSEDAPSLQPSYSQWGEFTEDSKPKLIKKKTVFISPEEQVLLKEEFTSMMYQHFLDGDDDDFNYENVDNNDQLDTNEIKDYDEEDKYFDSEEPEFVQVETDGEDDELDIFMNELNNQNPLVNRLSKDMQKL